MDGLRVQVGNGSGSPGRGGPLCSPLKFILQLAESLFCSSLAGIVHGQRLRAVQAIACVQCGECVRFGDAKYLHSRYVNTWGSVHFIRATATNHPADFLGKSVRSSTVIGVVVCGFFVCLSNVSSWYKMYFV